MASSPLPPLLVLTGFMGAGKTTLGNKLSQSLGWPLFDLDSEIARIHGPIPQLFAERGESGFRAIEHYQLDRTLLTLPRPSILALGGGAFVEPSNRQLLERNTATVIFLDAPFDVLYSRIAASAGERPLVAAPGVRHASDPAEGRERLSLLYKQRRPSYLLAHHVVDTSAASADEVLASLVRIAQGAANPAGARDTL